MAPTYVLGPFRLDAKGEILFRGAEPVALGQRAVALLRVLVEQPGIPVSKDALMDAAWAGVTVEESNLAVQISALRRVFGQEPGGEVWIETLPRRGYRFVGPASVEEGGTIIAATPISKFPTAGAPSLTLPKQPSIAVLPFQNMSGDPEQDYFADGISEDIITELSRFHALFVIARNSSFAFRGKSIKVQEIARELGVAYVLEGSVRRAADRVRITAQLIDGSNGGHVWAERYDRDLTDIFTLQDEVARFVASTVSGRVEVAGRARAMRLSPRH
jgi:TolB-like protein